MVNTLMSLTIGRNKMDQQFRSAGYDWRLYYGSNVIEQHLPEAVKRAKAQRVFVVCSPSITRSTNVIDRLQVALGTSFAGFYDGIEKDSTFTSVMAACEAAKAADADLLVAIGGGSVIVAARAVAIFMAEKVSPYELMTQYPEGKRPFSPRLMAPKLPIVNIPSTPTNAMNRAGTGLKNTQLDHRMEFFDPKTRPQSIFLDTDFLLTTPDGVLRSTATTVFADAVSSFNDSATNPLVSGTLQTAFSLAYEAYLALSQNVDDPKLRLNLCLAAFLSNRAEDDGYRRNPNGPFAGNYAVSTALHIRFPEVGQGESTSVLHSTVLRRKAEEVTARQAQRAGTALGIWQEGMTGNEAAMATADRIDAIYDTQGIPTRVSQLGIPLEGLPLIAEETVKNFNASSGTRSPEQQTKAALALLEAAW